MEIINVEKKVDCFPIWHYSSMKIMHGTVYYTIHFSSVRSRVCVRERETINRQIIPARRLVPADHSFTSSQLDRQYIHSHSPSPPWRHAAARIYMSFYPSTVLLKSREAELRTAAATSQSGRSSYVQSIVYQVSTAYSYQRRKFSTIFIRKKNKFSTIFKRKR
jgi:hypothetical protein